MAAAQCWIDTGAAFPAGEVPGFSGRFRERCADFAVTELGPGGAAVKPGPAGVEPPPEPQWVRGHVDSARAERKRRRIDAGALREAAKEQAGGASSPAPAPSGAEGVDAAADFAAALAEAGAPDPASVAADAAALAAAVAAEDTAADEAAAAAAAPAPVPVAAVEDRDMRRRLYRALRLVHPQLTTTGAAGQSGAAERPQTCIARCAHYAALRRAVGAEGAGAVVRLALHEAEEADADPPPPLRLRYETQDKECKKGFHQALRKGFGVLNASVVEGLVQVRRAGGVKRRGGGGGGGEGAVPWTHFVLQKQGLAWFAARHLLAQALRVPEEHITCAGIKDKKGVTVQRCAARGAHGRALVQFRFRGGGRAAGRPGGDTCGAAAAGSPAAADAGAGALADQVLADDDGCGSGADDDEGQELSVSSITYSRNALSAGELSGNHFTIRLRGCPEGERERASRSVAAVAARGFPNYFGPQRFGLGPREGLHPGAELAKGDWRAAAAAVLRPTSGDRGEAGAAKSLFAAEPESPAAWAAALARMPRACANERALLQGMVANPQSPQLWFQGVAHSVKELWIHAAQSWVWNRVLRDRLRQHGCAVLPGDLVLPGGRGGEPTACSDAAGHSIADVVLPKPGGGAAFPENATAAFYDSALAELGLPRGVWEGARALRVHLSKDYRRMFARCGSASCSFPAPGETEVSFSLPPSSYATVCLGAMMGTFLE